MAETSLARDTDLLTVEGMRALNAALRDGLPLGLPAHVWWARLCHAHQTVKEQANLYPRWPAELGEEMDRAVQLFSARPFI